MSSISKQQIINFLRIVSYAYLILPHLIFFLTWINSFVGIPIIGLLGFSFYTIVQQNRLLVLFEGHEKVALRTIGLLVAISFLLTLWAGVGGYFFQRHDYIKINAIFRTLIEREWPIHFYNLPGIAETSAHFNYYMAYKLPIALFAKWIGIRWADDIALIWTFLGFTVVLLWFALLSGKDFWIPVIVFFLFNGLEPILIYGYVCYKILIGQADWDFLYHILRTGWDVFLADKVFRYNGNYIALTWVPHHAIGTWLAMSLFLYEVIQNKKLSNVAFLVGIMLLWSPFPSVSIALLGLFYLIAHRNNTIISFQNLFVAPVLALVFFFMYKAHYPLNSPDAGDWTWKAIPFPTYIWIYLVFVTIKFGAYATCIHQHVVKSVHKHLWYFMLIMLLLLPHYRIGTNNDSLANMYVPFMFLLMWQMARHLSERSLWKDLRIRVLAFLLLMGGSDAIRTVLISWFRPILEPTLVTSVPIQQSRVFEKLTEVYDEWFLRQYIGKNDSFYAEYLLKEK
ncbi:MAG: hypothetical protein NZM38_05195 [Cytophagales bacterium]|nr:hypothetical protein [Cytophagales bacterium]MDW8384149.1 hypothetical protein [Flammeovirgaceae bacterium]